MKHNSMKHSLTTIPNPLSGRFEKEKAKEVYEKLAVPLLCMTHGWVESKNYYIDTIEHLGAQLDTIHGTCPVCNRPLQRVFPTGNELLIFPLAVQKLHSEGRLIDKRKSE